MENTPKRSVAEIRAELEEAEKIENEQRTAQRVAYETLKDETVTGLCMKALEIHNLMTAFKWSAFSDMQTIYKMLQEYSSRPSEDKGNFRIESADKMYRVSYKRQGKATFDERSQQAEKHIIDFVNSKYVEDPNTRELIMSLLERKNGELDIALVQKLYAMEDRFTEENWKKGIALLKESYQYSHSKDYVQFEFKDNNGQWNTINLQFSNLAA